MLKWQKSIRQLCQPLHDKMQEVIAKIAVQHVYTFVLNRNTDAGPVVFSAQQSFDLSELVLEKLKAMAPKTMQPPVIGAKSQLPTTSPIKPVKKK